MHDFKSFKTEVDEESAELAKKIQFLRGFLNSARGSMLSSDHRNLLMVQIDIMVAYRGILVARILLMKAETA